MVSFRSCDVFWSADFARVSCVLDLERFLIAIMGPRLLVEFSVDPFGWFVDEVIGDICAGSLIWFDGPLSVAGVCYSFIW